jgi:hypothetical protein
MTTPEILKALPNGMEVGENGKLVLPKGKPEKSLRGLGDVVHAIAQPIAKAIDKVAKTNLQNCGACAKRRETLNQIVPL